MRSDLWKRQSSTSDGAYLEELVGLFQYQQMIIFCASAVLAVLVYDAVICFDVERHYFWRPPRKITTWLLIAIRCTAIFSAGLSLTVQFSNLSLLACKFSIWGSSIADAITLTCMDYILYLRVIALYSNHRKLSTILFALLVIVGAMTLAAAIAALWREHLIIQTIGEGLTWCGAASVGNTELPRTIFWASPLGYESILLLLVIYKTVRLRWDMKEAGLPILMRVLVQDQVVYFVFVALCSILNLLSSANNSTLWTAFGFVLGGADMLALVGSRLLVRLKRAAGAGVGGVRGVRIGGKGAAGAWWNSGARSYDWEDVEMSEIRFS